MGELMSEEFKLEQKLKDAFEKYDIQHTGKIMYSDLVTAITFYCKDNELKIPNDFDYNKVLGHFDTENSDSFDFGQFKEYLMAVINESSQQALNSEKVSL
ncbi:unnamed protein product [Blepharisma stoltei]|uniref:EF-hand domain-containing protein n=1 Tax=Blepharisma stoltei TaxID=1481888 RepID=A0AAU9J320_9CILI|nr:unnamed protein product [Blepharisma stoltei]